MHLQEGFNWKRKVWKYTLVRTDSPQEKSMHLYFVEPQNTLLTYDSPHSTTFNTFCLNLETFPACVDWTGNLKVQNISPNFPVWTLDCTRILC